MERKRGEALSRGGGDGETTARPDRGENMAQERTSLSSIGLKDVKEKLEMLVVACEKRIWWRFLHTRPLFTFVLQPVATNNN